MCLTCYQDYGSPIAIADKVRQAIELMSDAFFPSTALHEITSGWDLRDDTVAHCRRKARTKEESTVAALFQRMTIAERATALAVDQGLIQEIDSHDLHTDMEEITIQALIPLMVRGELFPAGERVEVSRDRARVFIQRGHAKPVAKQAEAPATMVERPKPKRRSRKRKADESASD